MFHLMPLTLIFTDSYHQQKEEQLVFFLYSDTLSHICHNLEQPPPLK